MGVSADVSAGDDALASQYNNLRQDVNHDTLSHGHTAVSRDGKLIALAALATEVTDKLGQTIGLVRKVVVLTTGTVLVDVVNIIAPGRLVGFTGRGSLAINWRGQVTIDGTILNGEEIIGVAPNNVDFSIQPDGDTQSDDELAAIASSADIQALRMFFKTSMRVQIRGATGTTSNWGAVLFERD